MNTRFTHITAAMVAAVITAAAVATIGLSVSAVADEMRPHVPEVEWNTPLRHFQFDADKYIGQRLTVMCPPRHVTDEDAAIYGVDVYSSASPICVSAVHAGAVTTDGGMVTIQLNPGRDAYEGAVRNGVASSSLPGTERSMVFIGLGDDGEADAVQDTYVQRLAWDDKFTRTGLADRNLVGQRFAFDCPAAPADLRLRRVAGTDTYAFDSIICQAAVHAGAITLDGGRVAVQMNPAARDLVGSIRNGIETQSAGSSGVRSISFVGHSLSGS